MPGITGQKKDGPQLDFFILGPAKSGKSALYDYLRTHPQVFLPDFKELNFYADDIAEDVAPIRRRMKTRQAYREKFAGAADGQLLGEMSGMYLLSERAVPSILRDSPDARFIVTLRNPIDMAQSQHSFVLRKLYEDESSFQKAWELQEARAAGERIPRFCTRPSLLHYRERSCFAWQLERFFQRVPRERVLVHIFEEFFADPKAGYARTLAFLGLPDDGRRHFERVDEHALLRSALLHHLAIYPKIVLNRLYRPLKWTFNAFGLRPGVAILRANVRLEKRAPMDPSFRRRLEAEFQPEIARLEAVLGRDLDVWRSR